jgi:chemosensory pili system protein ChpA (sensor histidine kinase/response regulator)
VSSRPSTVERPDETSATLQLIAREVAVELNEARAALEAFAENIADAAALRRFAEHIHLARGALRVAEVYGGALLAEEMEHVALYVAEHSTAEQLDTDGLDALMRSMEQLPSYVERVASGGRDVPLALMPLLNDLRAVRGGALLSEGTLLLLNLHSDEQVHPVPEGGTRESVADLAHRLRPGLQRALLGWIRGERAESNLAAMGEVAARLESCAATQPVFQLWWVVGAVIEALREQGLESNVSIKRLLGQVDREMRRLHELGEPACAAAAPVELLNNLLFYVARSRSAGPRVAGVRGSFRLDDVLSASTQSGDASETLSAPSVRLMKTVAAAIREDLTHVKDVLDIFVRKGATQVDDLVPQLEMLRKIGDTLGVLGLGMLRDRVQAEIDSLSGIVERRVAPGDADLLGIAAALIDVEDHLDTQLVKLILPDGGRPAPGEPTDEEFRQVQDAVLRECIINMARIKEAITHALGAPEEAQGLDQVPQLVRGITAGLLMLGKQRAVEVMEALGRSLGGIVRPDAGTLATSRLESLADAIVSVEYYMEMLQAGRQDPWHMLEHAEACLAQSEPGGAKVVSLRPTQAEPAAAAGEPAAAPAADEAGATAGDAGVRTEAAIEVTAAPAAPAAATPVPPTVRPEAHVERVGAQLEAVDPEFVQLFAEEARENIGRLVPSFELWEQNPADGESLREVRRVFHTLKGSGRMVGARRISEFSWSVESLLNRVISQTLARSPDIMDIVRASVGLLPQLVDELERGEATGADIESLMSRADALSGREATMAPSGAPAAPARPEAGAAAPPAAGSEEVAPVPPREAGERKAASMDPVLQDIFRKETAGHVAVVRGYIERCGEGAGPFAVTEALYRACHTLSGIAKTAGVRQGIKVAEPMEHYVRKLYDNGRPLPAEGLSLLRDTVRSLENVVEHVEEDTGYFPDNGRLIAGWHALERSLDAELARLTEAAERTVASYWQTGSGEEAGGPDEATAEIEELTDSSLQALADRIGVPPELDVDATSPHAVIELPPEQALPSSTAPAQPSDEAAFPTFEPEAGAPPTEPVPPEPAPVGQSESPPPEPPEAGPPELSPGFAAGALHELPPGFDAAVPPPPQPSPVDLEPEFDADIAAIFSEEASELLEQADAALLSWSRDRADRAQVTELKRLLHTLKGGARMSGIRAMGDLSHEIESFLAAIETGSVASDGEAVAVLQSALDELHHMRDAANAGLRLVPAHELIGRVRAVAAASRAAQEAPGAVTTELAAEPLAIPTQVEPPPEAPAASEPPQVPTTPEPTPIAEAPTSTEDVELADHAAAEDAASAEETPAEPGHRSVREEPIAEELRSDEAAPVTAEGPVAGETPAAEEVLPAEVPTFDTWPGEIAVERPAAIFAEGAEAAAGRSPQPPSGGMEEPPAVTPMLPGREPIATPERQELARVNAELLDELLNNAGEVSIFRARVEQQMTSIEFNLAELGRTVTRLREQLRKLELETEAQILFKHQADTERRADFDPLELDRYSTIQQLSRALAESVSDVASIEGLLANLNREGQNLLQQQGRVVADLQNGLMRTRMVPFQRHTQRLTRLVRQSAQETGKRVELVVEGASGELDRQVLERMLPPFEHMLRNAVVHGIESPEERRARGKPESGNIAVRLQREGAEVVIVVEDDGAGLNIPAIRDKARQLGLLRPAQDLTDEEALQLVLEPGFSTADRLTQQAGRGVGMDVVATEVKKLGGGLYIESTPGQGARFTIRLPFTLAITQALIVRVHDEFYALPVATVEGVARLPRGEIERHLEEDQPTFEYGGQAYRFQHLGNFLGSGPSILPDTDVALPVILVRAGEHSTALVADELVGSREIVVKSVGPQVASIRGISGATILGDGRIVVILDMGALVRSEWRGRPVGATARAVRDDRIFALVVDDSITVRRVTQRLLERNGMRVMTAKDGVDALSMLQEHVPDVILLDIEMPRMDGYEVASHVRNDPRLVDVPIIMITSRVGEKHRARAIELGVDDYLGKPYQESQLLDAIEPLVLARRRQPH